MTGETVKKITELKAIQIESLRGFSTAMLELTQPLTLLVGPNNSGKTSILRLLDWALNRVEHEVLTGMRPPSNEDLDLLLPARDTRGAARRLSLYVQIHDGRTLRRFPSENGVVRLRLTYASGLLRVNVGPPSRTDPRRDTAALELLTKVQEETFFTLIPAARDAGSATFKESLESALRAKLEERAIHAARGGAPSEYRKVSKALGEIEDVAKQLMKSLWDEMASGIPPGLARDGVIEPQLNPQLLVEWLVQNSSLRLRTGSHDSRRVRPLEVGSGLQSLLELAVQRSSEDQGGDRIIAIEEPEAFLHPSAQRALSRILLEKLPGKRLVSTHSAILVDEANYGDVVLVRDHKFYAPRESDDAKRIQINTALMNGYGSEMLFSRSVLLVEGEGDRLFFEGLRRRLVAAHEDGRLDTLSVVPVGSKSAFAPRLRLLRSYGEEGNRPINWLLVADGGGATEVRRAYRDAGFAIPQALRDPLNDLARLDTKSPAKTRSDAAVTINNAASRLNVRVHFLAIDLEWIALKGASDETIKMLIERLGLESLDRTSFLNKLGSRYDSPVSRARKDPWMRALIAQQLPWDEVSKSAKRVLQRWFETVMTRTDARALIGEGD